MNKTTHNITTYIVVLLLFVIVIIKHSVKLYYGIFRQNYFRIINQ